MKDAIILLAKIAIMNFAGLVFKDTLNHINVFKLICKLITIKLFIFNKKMDYYLFNKKDLCNKIWFLYLLNKIRDHS